MNSAKKPGQILILVLLVVVVSLAVGLSVASRNITNIRTSTQTEESQKAFSAAEGGIESVLSRGLDSAIIGDNPVTVGGITAHVNVERSPNNYPYNFQLTPGSIAQVSLEGMAAGNQVKVSWCKAGEPCASVEITQQYDANSQNRFAYAGVGGRADETGFASATAGCLSPYQRCATITLSATPHLLRIRPFWSTSSFSVDIVPGQGSLPVQNYTLTSTASTADGITRTVQVTKSTLPQVPAVFDYAVYSDQAINK